MLQTERVTLAPFAATDIDLAVELFTDPEVLKYAGGAVSEDEVREDLPNWTKRGGENGCIGIWCISNNADGDKLGSIALLPIPIEEDDTDFSLLVPDEMPDCDVEVGYFLKRSAWGKGYATEACGRIIRFALEETPLTEFVATFEPGNTASQHVLKKVRFVDHGSMRSYGEDGPIYRTT